MERNRELDVARLAWLLFGCWALTAFAADERVLEAATASFRRQDYGTAARLLRSYVAVSPGHPLANDFLGTIYFLDGNLAAALRYWNRKGKPVVSAFELPAGLRTDAEVVDRAVPFATGDVLTVDKLRTAEARIRALRLFEEARLELEGSDDGSFTAKLAGREGASLGGYHWKAWLSTLRGIGFQALHPEYRTAAGLVLTSLVRWDAQKRRLAIDMSKPVGRQSRYSLRLGADGRDELWELRPAARMGEGEFRLRKTALRGGVLAVPSGTWQWAAEGEWSYREVASRTGYALKQTIRVERALWRVPERRFQSSVQTRGEIGRLWMGMTSSLFGRLETGVRATWHPQRRGDAWVLRTRTGAGTIAGTVPFDELYQLGVERDNGLWMRGHTGTQDGRKGSAPLGRRYGLANLEVDRKVFGNGLVAVWVSPFLDFGRMERTPWLVDVGLQAKLRVLGLGFTFSYGRDTRRGRNAFYAWSTPDEMP